MQPMWLSIVQLLTGIFTLVELNCENLFDCQHDSLKQDQEFLAESPRHWNTHRYWDKLNHIGQEIIACGESSDGWTLPDMVLLCEVENDSVCRDLCRRSMLRQAGYDYLVTESPDLRGIDVALLYSPFSFRPVTHYAIRVDPLSDMRPTRDILYASGQTTDGDTLHVFVVHAPSRYGGEHATRPHRLQVADRLCQSIDSIRALSPHPRIVIAGDFNDYHDNAAPRQLEQHGLHNISKTACGSHGARGTYKYEGSWRSLDHIFVSEGLLVLSMSCRIFDAPFLLKEDKEYGGVMPRRNYNGLRYENGYSDHLPLVARFRF